MRARVQRIILGLFLSLLALTGIALALRQSQRLAERVRQRLVETAERDYHVTLRIKRLDHETRGRKLTLSGVDIVPVEAPADPPFLTVKSITVYYRVISWLTGSVAIEEVRVQQPVVRLVLGEDRRSACPWDVSRDPMEGWLNSSLRKLTVHDGQVELTHKTHRWSSRIERWSATVSYQNKDPQAYAIHLSCAKGHVAWSAGALADIGADLDLDLSRKGLLARVAHIRASGLNMRASGNLYTVIPLRYQGYFDSDINLDELAKQCIRPPDSKTATWATGTLKVNGNFSGNSLGAAVSARLQAAALALGDLPMQNVTAELSLGGRQLRISPFHASVPGGNIKADYTLSGVLAEGDPSARTRSVLHFTLQAVNLPAWARAAMRPNVPAEGRLSGTGRLEWFGADIEHATGRFAVGVSEGGRGEREERRGRRGRN